MESDLTKRKMTTPDDDIMRIAATTLEKVAHILQGKGTHCIHCGKPATFFNGARNVYAEPCGHRQFQGHIPPDALEASDGMQ